jgi:hypothetical protein
MRASTRMSAAAVWGVIVAVSGAAPWAQAQEVRTLTVRAGIGGPGDSGMITRRSVEKFGALLGLDEATREAVQVSHEGYTAAFQQVQKARREAMDAVRREVEETEDHSLWGSRLPSIEKAFRTSSRKLEDEFMADLRIMSGEAGQGPAWERVERMRRREQVLKGGGMSGEGVDLVELVGSIPMPPEAMSAAEPTLLDYEAEMDRQAQARLKMFEEQGEIKGLGQGLDPGRMEAMLKDFRESGAKLRDVNMRFARKIESALPDEQRAAFASEFRKRCFPAVYKVSRAQRELDAAIGMTDLTGEQRELLASLRDSYQREARAVNEAWAAAIEDQEKSGASAGMSFAGAQIKLMNGEEPEALRQARQSRRDLDKRVRERLSSALTPAQRDRLPREPEDDGVAGQKAFFIEAK